MPSSKQQFDLIVIGSGSAGDGAIDEAHRSRHSIAIVEKDKVGGDCPNYACMPTKALLRSAKIYSLLKRTGGFGLSSGAIEFDWLRVMARKEQVIRRTDAAGTKQRYHKGGIALFEGTAAFEDEHHIRVNEQALYGDKIMVATGSRPAQPAMPGMNEVQPITSVEAISLPKLPTSLIILGGGPVGCEFAQLFSTFDVQVTLLQKARTILPHEEPEISQIVQPGRGPGSDQRVFADDVPAHLRWRRCFRAISVHAFCALSGHARRMEYVFGRAAPGRLSGGAACNLQMSDLRSASRSQHSSNKGDMIWPILNI